MRVEPRGRASGPNSASKRSRRTAAENPARGASSSAWSPGSSEKTVSDPNAAPIATPSTMATRARWLSEPGEARPAASHAVDRPAPAVRALEPGAVAGARERGQRAPRRSEAAQRCLAARPHRPGPGRDAATRARPPARGPRPPRRRSAPPRRGGRRRASPSRMRGSVRAGRRRRRWRAPATSSASAGAAVADDAQERSAARASALAGGRRAHVGRGSRPSGRAGGGDEVRDQVLGILEADRDAHRARATGRRRRAPHRSAGGARSWPDG